MIDTLYLVLKNYKVQVAERATMTTLHHQKPHLPNHPVHFPVLLMLLDPPTSLLPLHLILLVSPTHRLLLKKNIKLTITNRQMVYNVKLPERVQNCL